MVGSGALAACTLTAKPDQGPSNIRLVGDDANDQLSVDCSNRGRVRVNGDRPAGGPIACADVVSIVVDGGGGNDQIRLERLNPSDFGSLRSIRLEGGDGNDWIYASHATDVLAAGLGDDVISGDLMNDDRVDGGEGIDVVDVSMREGMFRIGSYTSVESVEVKTRNDVVVDARRFAGELRVRGGAGDDTIFGGTGPNEVSAGEGNDHIVGGPLKDRLQGGDGNDQIEGKAGNELLYDGKGADDVRGGPGNDRFFMVTDAGNRFDGGPGRDLVHVLAGGDMRLRARTLITPDGRARVSSFERAELLLYPDYGRVTIDARGFAGGTFIRSQSGDDILFGGDGRDLIQASWGDDLIHGGAGDDTIEAFKGLDTCDGGPGEDAVHDCER
jgi:Ca2+-binding RTX toxin-like protein